MRGWHLPHRNLTEILLPSSALTFRRLQLWNSFPPKHPYNHLKTIWMHILCKCKAKQSKSEISEGQNVSNEIILKRPLKTENSSSVKDCYPGTELLLRGWAPEHRASHGDLPVDGRSHQLRAAAGGFPSLGFPPQQDEFLKSPVLQTPVFKITFRQLWPIPVY